MRFDHINVPADGARITANPDHSLNVPDFPIIPFIEGDGIGIDVTPVMRDVVNAAVEKAYGDSRAIKWMQVYAGAKATEIYGENEFLPEETLHALQKYLVSIKGPLSTPTGGGIRSLNVAIRQSLDLIRLRSAYSVFPWRANADAGIRARGHDGVPREHRGYLCRHRISNRFGGSTES